MTIVEELKALYVKTGGTAATVAGLETVSEVLAAYTALVDGAGSVLPAVTAADNGSVLTVVDGAWAAVAPESAQQ